MPDCERVLRKLTIDLCETDQEKEIITAYYRGLDRARIEAVVVVLILAVIGVIIGCTIS